MAVYSLQQLLKQLSEQLGIDLEIAWTLCSEICLRHRLFQYHEGLDRLKGQASVLAEQLEEGSIGMQSKEYDIEQLSSIARFLPFIEDCYRVAGFPRGTATIAGKTDSTSGEHLLLKTRLSYNDGIIPEDICEVSTSTGSIASLSVCSTISLPIGSRPKMI